MQHHPQLIRFPTKSTSRTPCSNVCLTCFIFIVSFYVYLQGKIGATVFSVFNALFFWDNADKAAVSFRQSLGVPRPWGPTSLRIRIHEGHSFAPRRNLSNISRSYIPNISSIIYNYIYISLMFSMTFQLYMENIFRIYPMIQWPNDYWTICSHRTTPRRLPASHSWWKRRYVTAMPRSISPISWGILDGQHGRHNQI